MRGFGRAVLAVVMCAFMAGCATTGRGGAAGSKEPAMATGFIIKTVVIDGAEQVYSVYIPKDYDPKKAWPLVMFLHGIGERGSDGLLQTEVGIGRAIRRWPERFPCIVIMPQCPTTKTWGSDIELIDQSMQITREECNIDPDRIYLTGLSMGGFGTWMYGAKHPDFFAALLPICGGGKTAAAPILAKLPIWAFHGLDDTTVPPKMSQEMVEAVRKAGGDVRYTEYPGVGHNSWDNAYADPEVVAWMLQQKRAH